MFTLIDALERKPKGKPDMSPHAVNTFVSDLVLMAQAMERLPQIELRVSELESENDAWMHKYESLQNDIAQAKAYASTLEQRLHDAEVAKDAAETMFLEADERTSRALDFIKATFGNAGTLIQALEPPRPDPIPTASQAQPEPVADTISAELSATPSSPGPYAGKRYFDIPTYVPLDAWLAGGGTEADYHWGPSHPSRL